MSIPEVFGKLLLLLCLVWPSSGNPQLQPVVFPAAQLSEGDPGPPELYDGWTVVKIEGVNDVLQRNADKVEEVFLALEDRQDTVVLQQHRLLGFYHVAVSPNSTEELIADFKSQGFTVTNLNVSISEQIALASLAATRADVGAGEFTTERFMTLEEIDEFTKKFAADNKPYVTRSVIGRTWEGRNIYMLTITSPFRKSRKLDSSIRTLDAFTNVLHWENEAGEYEEPIPKSRNSYLPPPPSSAHFLTNHAQQTSSPHFNNVPPRPSVAQVYNRADHHEKNAVPVPDDTEDSTSLIDSAYESLQNLFGYFRGQRSLNIESSDTKVKRSDPRELNSVSQTSDAADGESITFSDDPSTPRAAGSEKPVIVIDGGIHAREWVSPASVMYMATRIVNDAFLLDNFEWKIIPVLNPDGYTYSWTHDRLWRKNRSCNNGQFRRGGKCSSSIRGVDLNRNFGFHWGETGSSSHVFSDIFKGQTSFSEPESRALRDMVLGVKSRVKAYVSVHSYGQMILHSWGYTKAAHPQSQQQLEMGLAMGAAMKAVHGEAYTVGSAAGVLYAAAGGSDDWVGSQGVTFSYTFELRDRGQGGFVLQPWLIKPAVEEAFAGIEALAHGVYQKYVTTNISHRPFTRVKQDKDAEETFSESAETVSEHGFRHENVSNLASGAVETSSAADSEVTKSLPVEDAGLTPSQVDDEDETSEGKTHVVQGGMGESITTSDSETHLEQVLDFNAKQPVFEGENSSTVASTITGE